MPANLNLSDSRIREIKEEFKGKESRLRAFRTIAQYVISARNLIQKCVSELDGLLKQLKENYPVREHDMQILDGLHRQLSKLKEQFSTSYAELCADLGNSSRDFIDSFDLTLKQFLVVLAQLTSASEKECNSSTYLKTKQEIIVKLSARLKEIHDQLSSHLFSSISSI